MSKIANAPTAPNTGGYETRTKVARTEAVAMAGQNAGGFENRVTQEAGSH